MTGAHGEAGSAAGATGGAGRQAIDAAALPKVDHNTYPALFQAADAGSVGGQRTYRRLVKIELAFVLAGALFGTAGTFLEPRVALATLATICLLGSMSMKFVNRFSDSTERWFDGRAVAETVKTETWRFMMKVVPYDDESTAHRRFVTDLVVSMRARPTLFQSLGDVPLEHGQITPTMLAVRALPFNVRRQLYIDQRLSNQAAWYRGKAVVNLRNARRWFWLSLVGQGAAAAIAFTSIFEPQLPLSSFVGFFAALATAATAWTQLGRHDELSKSYALAYQELVAIRNVAQTVTSKAALAQLINDGEGAISREHTMWVAKRELQRAVHASDKADDEAADDQAAPPVRRPRRPRTASVAPAAAPGASQPNVVEPDARQSSPEGSSAKPRG